MFLTLIFGTVEWLEIHIFLKIELEWIDYILIDYKVISQNFRLYSIARKQNKVVQSFVKPLTVILFRTQLGTVRIEGDFRFGTTTELYL